MSKWNPIYTCPKDGTAILVHIPDKGWIQSKYEPEVDKSDDKGRTWKYGGWWDHLKLNSHGCGCCSSEDKDPDAWAPLPVQQ